MIEDILMSCISGRFSSEETYRSGHVRIVNPLPRVSVLGLHVPDMKAIAKELAKSDGYRDVLDRFERACHVEDGSCGVEGKDVAGKSRAGLYYEETVVWGLMLDFAKMGIDERLGRFAAFVPQIDNWAVCDVVCGAAKWAAAKRKPVPCVSGGGVPEGEERKAVVVNGVERRRIWEFLERYWISDREFEVRFAVIMAMSYFLDDEWLPEVFSKLDSLDFSSIRSEYRSQSEVMAEYRARKKRNTGVVYGNSMSPGNVWAGDISAGAEGGEMPLVGIVRCGEGYSLGGLKAGTVLGLPPYYVRMGVAWLLATALAKFPDETRRYVNSCSLPEDVLKLYARKVRESFRTRTWNTY